MPIDNRTLAKMRMIGGGSGGSGGGEYFNNGIIKQEALPEGFPYSKIENTLLVAETMSQLFPVGETGGYVAMLSTPIELVIGRTYKVIFNANESYTCVAVEAMGAVAFGNVSKMLGIGDTGEPFIVTNEAVMTFNSDTYAIEIYGDKETVKQMDKKFIPPLDSSVHIVKITPNGNGDYICDTDSTEIMRLVLDESKFVFAEVVSTVNPAHTLYLSFAGFDGRVAYFGALTGDNAFPSLRWIQVSGVNAYVKDDFLSAATIQSLTLTNPVRGLILSSTTAGSTKKFYIRVDDSGTISATKVTE